MKLAYLIKKVATYFQLLLGLEQDKMSANHINHVEWIDRCKGILIFLVVLGHVVGPNAHLTAANVCGFYEAFYCVIYSFHMPAFFFLAGMTFKMSNDSFLSFVVKKFNRLMVPYYAFGIMSLIIFMVAYSKFQGSIGGIDAYYARKAELDWVWLCVGLLHGGQWPNGEGLRMNAALWFLPCLFSTEIVFYWLNRILPSRRVVKFGLIVACALLAFVMVKKGCVYWPLGLNKVPYYLIFLIAGNMIGLLKDWNMQGCKQILSIVGCLVGMFFFTVAVGTMLDLSTMYYSSTWFSIFLIAAFVGIGLSIIFAQLIRIGLLRELGVLSLGIMVTHKFFLLGVQFGMPWIRKLLAESNILTSLFITFLVALLATGGAWFGSRIIMYFAPYLLGKSRGPSPKETK